MKKILNFIICCLINGLFIYLLLKLNNFNFVSFIGGEMVLGLCLGWCDNE